jgi:hypothetical protein
MALPAWPKVRKSLAAAIGAALPLQLRKAGSERIAGVGLHLNAYYGSAGLYLLPESAARALAPDAVDSLGDWPISTDWNPSDDHAQAFAAHWDKWDKWFSDHIDELDEAGEDERIRKLLRVACEAVRDLELTGLFDTLPKTEGFKIIIAEHNEPCDFSLERYSLFVRTGAVRSHVDSA